MIDDIEQFAFSPAIEEWQWNGTLEDYRKIIAWMRSWGCTYANAGEVIFRGDAIVWPRVTGIEVARKDDIIYRYTYPNQSTNMFAIKSTLNFSELRKQNLEDELAGVVICADLAASQAGIDLAEVIVRKFNKTSEKHGFLERLYE